MQYIPIWMIAPGAPRRTVPSRRAPVRTRGTSSSANANANANNTNANTDTTDTATITTTNIITTTINNNNNHNKLPPGQREVPEFLDPAFLRSVFLHVRVLLSLQQPMSEIFINN